MTARSSVTCVVQARMGSTRLPGKVLQPLAGKSMLRFLLDRLRPLAVDHIVVATTTLGRDDPIVSEVDQLGIPSIRGPETDVLQRFLLVLEAYPTDHVIRLTADCPLTDPTLVEAVVNQHLETRADYTSNVFPRTFPKGLDVEVITADALQLAGAMSTHPAEREHVTPFAYRHPERFNLANLRHYEWYGDERWTVDTRDDLLFVQEMAARMEPAAGWQAILAQVGVRHRPEPGTLHLRPAFAADSEDLLTWRNDPHAVAFSRSGRGVGPEEHSSWLSAALDSPATRLSIAEVDNVSVGQVRVDVSDAVGDVSIAVRRQLRGRGCGASILRLLQQHIRSDQQLDRLHAWVHPDNAASLRLFTGAGFVPTLKREGFQVLTWDRDRTQEH